ncbi:alpha/beta hydrolase-fold protein [uncultured Olegusella sp.]|uniref:alpha/beta hydrolase-fold protein n=1 Tax=uncultured Olegusella sp. TaxID=1979846 RepID=UPI002614087A|nr:alpha/beta hydrolase-fold protein [uncultured Olegusella sp.]
MESFETTIESSCLNEDLDVIVYGSGGTPLIVFPSFDFSAGSWETGGMVDALTEFIETKKIQLFCTDSVDGSSWYARSADLTYRSDRQKAFLEYVQTELLPYVKKTSRSRRKPLLVGCGAGATNAAATLLKDPSLYGGLLALSGAFDARFYSDGVTTLDWLSCSPIDLMQNLTAAQLKQLNEIPLAFVCGQSPDETGAETMRHMDERMAELGIHASFEYWGFDVSHNWYWWKKMACELVPAVLERAGLAKRRQMSLKALADAANAKLDDMKANAQQRFEEEKFAEHRLKSIIAEIKEKTELADAAAETAKDAWDKRNETAALLASLDQKASALQAEADAAVKFQHEAEWFAGEARNSLKLATTARLAAEARVSAAQEAADLAKSNLSQADALVSRLQKSTTVKKKTAKKA